MIIIFSTDYFLCFIFFVFHIFFKKGSLCGTVGTQRLMQNIRGWRTTFRCESFPP